MFVFISGASPDVTRPTSTSATAVGPPGGFAYQLDPGDRIVIDFADTGCGATCAMSIAANAVIRVTDSDCGPVNNAGPAACAGAQANTVADLICNTNAVCTLQAGPNGPFTEVSVVVVGNPVLVFPGSVAGLQLPVIVTDSSGITDLSSNPWNVEGSADRVIEPAAIVAGPISTAAAQSSSAGFTNMLDGGDSMTFDFNVAINLSGNPVIRFTDSDCGPATNTAPAVCTGGNTNTVADVVCATNATCAVLAGPNGSNTRLFMTVTGAPIAVATGSAAGAQLPLIVTDVTGIGGGGNPWNLPGSPDRLIEPLASSGGPTSPSATLTISSGFANTLDAGDVAVIDFNQTMVLSGITVLRLTDSDCGAATNAGPALCSGGNTNTVADIICGTNATCVLRAGPGGANAEMVVTMTNNPTIVAPGSTAAVQFPVLVTDTSGISSSSGSWDLTGSADRLFGPFGS